MRQVLTWRFLAAIGALVAAALLVNALFANGSTVAELTTPFQPTERRPHLVAQVRVADGAGFAISETGQATTDLILTLGPDDRVVRIFTGTPGELNCPELAAAVRCTLVAELLGDSITWFSLVPMVDDSRFDLPAITDLDGGLAHLTNGWAFPYARVIDRSRCRNPGASFSEFLRTVGDDHRSLYDLRDGAITAVFCPNDPAD